MRLLRGFVIGNYWLMICFGLPVVFAIIATFNEPPRPPSEDAPNFIFAIAYSPFLIGFLLGWLRAKPKMISLIAAGVAGVICGLLWLLLMFQDPLTLPSQPSPRAHLTNLFALKRARRAYTSEQWEERTS